MQPVVGPSNPSSTTEPPRSPSAPGNPHITRKRVIYSCQTCRRRKVKCDKTLPVCGNCAKNGTECAYDPEIQKDGMRAKRTRRVRAKRQRDIPQSEENTDEPLPIYDRARQGSLSKGQKTDLSAVEAHLAQLVSLVERLRKDNQANESTEMQAAALNTGVQTAPMEDGSLGSKSIVAQPPSPFSAAADCSSDDFPIPNGQTTDLVDPLGTSNLGHMSLGDGGRSRYVGTTYWAYISHEMEELNQLLGNQNQPHDIATCSDTPTDSVSSKQRQRKESMSSRTTSRTTRSPFPVGFSEPLQKAVCIPSAYLSPNDKSVEPYMLEHVPTKWQSDILYKGFMSGVHSLSPIVHPPTILRRYKAFWDWYDGKSYTGEPCPSSSFIPLLYAIWFGGSVTISMRTMETEFNTSSRAVLSTKYSEEVTCWLAKISFPHSVTLHGLAAYLVAQTILSREEEPLASSLFVSLAVRVAQTLGLHRDPAHFNIDPWEAEFRRRVWWHIMHMDAVIAMSSGLPPLLTDTTYWDVRETSEVKDTLLGTAEAKRYEQQVADGQRPPDNPDNPTVCGGPSMVNVYYLNAKAKCIMAQSVRKVLKIQLGTKPLTRGDMLELRSVLHDLQVKLNSIINRIPETTATERTVVSPKRVSHSTEAELPIEGPSGCPEQYHSAVLVAFHKWTKIILSLFIDKAFCVAYQPFLRNPRSRIWPVARQSALRHCYAFMEKFIRLATDPDFQPFQWGWPGNHQPMHAMMIILIDLYERPYSPEASVSRGFVDQILSLCGPDGGVVSGGDDIFTQRPLRNGGREAWGMIRRLRQQAWQKAGLNPELPWTGQDRSTNFANAPYFKSMSSANIPLSSGDRAFAPDSAFGRSSAATMSSQQSLVNSPMVNFLDTAGPNAMPASEPAPFMIDPGLNFDWGEWDNIFGQSLPVADELMELDQVTGLAFADLENSAPSEHKTETI
ncbi:transcriptional regulator family: Fungal Specific TF [Penicillium roqueforti]|nr:transcriptional regulator family: Fungal Specific TF [Penicillium roqueforti]KAI2702467.1 transcriptional regulator family: Fungal Specific TF [Penicillium roqueforti]KAI2728124.1 transcriptional regulator family: Fungal Specific TF [Penicillium roqueforti]KAI3109662.1 transcriptional regulator family: Fungal Specific TF [Penicillium roqueforti]KAI3163127.1 transcriptional regulator family: Fungal Specific TF [Penicillium roqueforti]